MDFGGSSSLLRFDNVSLDPRTEIITTASIRDGVENRNGSDSKHCLMALGLGLDAASGPTALAVTGWSLGCCHM